jgi:hypothetical protein
MGKMKQFIGHQIGYLVEAELIYKQPENIIIKHKINDIILHGTLDFEYVENIVTKIKALGHNRVPEEANLSIYKYYKVDNMEYKPLYHTVSLSKEDCKNLWIEVPYKTKP